MRGDKPLFEYDTKYDDGQLTGNSYRLTSDGRWQYFDKHYSSAGFVDVTRVPAHIAVKAVKGSK